MSKLKKKLKTQGENSKGRHFQNPWVPEKRPKKPDLNIKNVKPALHQALEASCSKNLFPC